MRSGIGDPQLIDLASHGQLFALKLNAGTGLQFKALDHLLKWHFSSHHADRVFATAIHFIAKLQFARNQFEHLAGGYVFKPKSECLLMSLPRVVAVLNFICPKNCIQFERVLCLR